VAYRERTHALARAKLRNMVLIGLTADRRHLRDDEIAALALASDDFL